MFELNDLEARYASDEDLSTLIRHRFTEPKQMLEEHFRLTLFNVLVGDTDDHARNRKAFRNEPSLTCIGLLDCPKTGRSGKPRKVC